MLEEGGGVSDQDPNQRLLWDRVDRGVELSVINKGEAVPENIRVKCDDNYCSGKPTFCLTEIDKLNNIACLLRGIVIVLKYLKEFTKKVNLHFMEYLFTILIT